MFDKLKAPFAPGRVSWRVGSTNRDKTKGLAFGYIDARDVMERLDEVCGPGGWQNRYSHANGKTVCDIGIKVGEEWIWKADGAGDTDVEAEKGALSDAFKRAAVRWGIGRYLYDIPTVWVEIEPAGKSYRIKESELQKLSRSLNAAAPSTATAPVRPNILSEPLAAEVMAQIKTEIGGCISIAELKKFVLSQGYIHRVGSLPENHRTQIRTAGEARLAELKKREAEQVAA